MQDLSKPIWINQSEKPVASGEKPVIFLATPVHSDVSIHYTQALLTLQQECFRKGIMISFSLMKSSLVTQGRNLCVSAMFEQKTKYTHLFFVDSDIEFSSQTLFDLIDADKDVIGAPYPMKTIDWQKIEKRREKHNIKDYERLATLGFMWPVKLENKDQLTVKDNIGEVTHVPTGCTLYKREVFEKMFEAFPDRKIVQPTIVNGKQVEKKYMYNLFDTYHEPETKRYYGEDFGFCKRWTEIGGKCHILTNQRIAHVGEYKFEGKIHDDLIMTKVVDEPNKNK